MFFTLNHLEITKFASLNLFETQTGAVTVLCSTFPSCHLARSAFPPPVSHFCTLLEHAAAARYRRKRDLRVSCSVWLQLLLRSYITAGSALRATSRSPAFENTLLFKTPWEIVWGGIELPRLCLVERPLCTYEIVCSFLFIYLYIYLWLVCVFHTFVCLSVFQHQIILDCRLKADVSNQRLSRSSLSFSCSCFPSWWAFRVETSNKVNV